MQFIAKFTLKHFFRDFVKSFSRISLPSFRKLPALQAVFLGVFYAYCVTPLAAPSIANDFPLVRDDRNFKESKGGKGVPPQGRVIEEKTRHCLLRKELLKKRAKGDWNYVVSVNCRRGDDIVKLLSHLANDFLPTTERNRLGIVLGINERVTVKQPTGFPPTWQELLPNQRAIKN